MNIEALFMITLLSILYLIGLFIYLYHVSHTKKEKIAYLVAIIYCGFIIYWCFVDTGFISYIIDAISHFYNSDAII